MIKKLIDKIKGLKPIHYVVIFFGIVLYLGAMVGVVNYQKSHRGETPTLEITTPVEGDIYYTDDVLIQGKSLVGAEISVGDIKTKTAEDGSFKLSAPLTTGQNTLTIIAKANGQKVEKKVTVDRAENAPVIEKKPAKPTAKATPKVTSNQKVTATKLNNSGPEGFWVLEAGLVSAAGAAWQVSRQKLQSTRKK